MARGIAQATKFILTSHFGMTEANPQKPKFCLCSFFLFSPPPFFELKRKRQILFLGLAERSEASVARWKQKELSPNVPSAYCTFARAKWLCVKSVRPPQKYASDYGASKAHAIDSTRTARSFSLLQSLRDCFSKKVRARVIICSQA